MNKYKENFWYKEITNKRLGFWFFIAISLLIMFVIGLYFDNTSVDGQSKLFSQTLSATYQLDNSGNIITSSIIYEWNLATFQYFTWTCFALVLFYYWILIASFLYSKFLSKKDNLIFITLINPNIKNAFVSMFLAMFVIVIFLLGPYSIADPDVSDSYPLATFRDSNQTIESAHMNIVRTSGSEELVSVTSNTGETINIFYARNDLVGTIGTVIIHIFFPIIVLIEHFTLTPFKKSYLGAWLTWILPFLIYIIYTLPISSSLSNNLGWSLFPYFFFDPYIVTWGGVIGTLIGLLIISYFLFWWLWKFQNNKYNQKNEIEKEKYNIAADSKELFISFLQYFK